MSTIQKASRFLLVLLAAVAAYVLFSIPPLIITQYEKIASVHPFLGYMYVGGVVFSLSIFLLLALWFALFLWRNTRSLAVARSRQARDITKMTPKEQREEIQQQMRETRAFIENTPVPAAEEAQIRERYDELSCKLESQTFEIVAFGTVSSGKSSLLNTLAGREVFRTDARAGTTITRNEIAWSEFDKVLLVDTPGLSEIHGAEREFLARRAARDADIVLFVLDGPLKDPELQILTLLVQMKKRVLIALNKADWFTNADLPLLLQQITEQVKGLVPDEDVVAIRAASATRTRVRILPDGTETEESITIEPDITALAERMRAVIAHDARGILLANLLLRSRGLVEDAKELVQASLDQRAAALVSTYMWQAGSIAALSPFPVVDVAAGLTISSKMVVDLARVYHQNLTVETALRLIRELSKTVLATLGATAATPAVATVIASVLKTVPGVGTLAGGALQGLTQAFVTRWIGRVFIAYFRNEMRAPQGGFDSLARAQWKEITKPTELARFVQEGASRLSEKEHRCG
jgi:small GTP-binding protein